MDKKNVKEFLKSFEVETRDLFEETFVKMISSSKYVDFSFYGFVIIKCKMKVDYQIPTAAVKFNGSSYDLYLGRRFREWNLDERMAVLIHECRHIIGLHAVRKEHREHELFNEACDMSINQDIKNLPKGALYPDTYKFPLNKTAEQYYDMLVEEKKKQEKEKKEYEDKNGKSKTCESCGGSGIKSEDSEGSHPYDECPDCGGTGELGEWKPSNGVPDLTTSKRRTLDIHDMWEESDEEFSEELAKTVASNMIRGAIESTDRSHLPGDMEQILSLFKRKPKVSWKKELRSILSSKRGKKISTIKKRNRRFPERRDLRGNKIKIDEHEIVVGVDTSGSMDDEEILIGLSEILNLSKNKSSELKIIQIDTNIKDYDVFSRNNQSFKRIGYGGTYMGEIVNYMESKKIKPDVLVMISDMEIENVSTDANWKRFKKPVLWLSTRGIIPTWSEGRSNHRVIDIKNK